MNITLEERIYGLSTLWKVAEYNFARWDELPELDWNAEYKTALSRIIATEDAYEYYRELQRFVTLLNDGHSYVVMPDGLAPPYASAFATTYLEGAHRVSAVPKDSGVAILSAITAINGTPIDDYLREKVYPFMWHARPAGTFKFGQLAYDIQCAERGTLTIETDGGTFTCEVGVGCEDTIESPYLTHEFYKASEKLYESDSHTIRKSADGIVYIEFPTFQNNDLKDELYANLGLIRDAKGFIIDIGYNKGGNGLNALAAAQLFFEEAPFSGASETPLYPAAYGAYGQYKEIDKLNLDDEWERKIYDVNKHLHVLREEEHKRIDDCPAFLPQPVVVLTSNCTASAAEYFLSALRNNGRATTVGDVSHGTTGQPYFGSLPGGGRYAICTLKCYDTFGFDYNNVGIAPDFYVEPTVADALAGFDRTLDVGLRVLREKMKPQEN